MAKRKINQRWQREMAEFFVHGEGVLPDQQIEPLDEIFHL
jgi:L-rhamnose mutarotase